MTPLWTRISFLGLLSVFCPTAQAGQADGEVGLDTLHATSRSVEAGAGAPEVLTATELGLRVRGRLRTVDDRLEARLDYRGTEPLPGDLAATRHRLLYAGEVRFEVVEGALTVGAGRFLAPSVVLLPVDGLRAEVTPVEGLTLSAFGGRRGISTSRRNLCFDRLLPAVGGGATWVRPELHAALLLAWAQDEVVIGAGSSGQVVEDVGGFNGVLRATVFPGEGWRAGAQVVAADQVTYLLGPTWSDFVLQGRGAALWSGLGWVSWRPEADLALDWDTHFQRSTVLRAGWRTEEGEIDPTAEPRFLDNRLRAGWSPAEVGWLWTDLRWRVRHDRQEWRYGLRTDLTTLPVPGLFARGRIAFDSITGDPRFDRVVDRLFWRAGLGWSHRDFEVEAGGSHVERSAHPVSGRRLDPANPGEPLRTEDLAPFVLEAQNVVFLRAFYGHRQWFGGLDLEHAVRDGEVRILVQTGVLGGVSW